MSALSCDSATRSPGSARARLTGVAAKRAGGGERLSRSFERVRDAVLRGAGMDFAQGTAIGGAAFEACVRGLLRRALDRPTIARLVQVYRRPHGRQFAAQALNALASPLGARCGHRPYVPELIDASRGLREGMPAFARGRSARAMFRAVFPSQGWG